MLDEAVILIRKSFLSYIQPKTSYVKQIFLMSPVKDLFMFSKVSSQEIHNVEI